MFFRNNAAQVNKRTPNMMSSNIDTSASSVAATPPPKVLLVGNTPTAYRAWRALHKAGFVVVAVVGIATDTEDDNTATEAFIRTCIDTYNLPPMPSIREDNIDTAESNLDGGALRSSISPSASSNQNTGKTDTEQDAVPDPLRGVKPLMLHQGSVADTLPLETDVVYFTVPVLTNAPTRMSVSSGTAVSTPSLVEQLLRTCIEQSKHVVMDVPVVGTADILLKWIETMQTANTAKILFLDSSARLWSSPQIPALRAVLGVTTTATVSASPAGSTSAFPGGGSYFRSAPAGGTRTDVAAIVADTSDIGALRHLRLHLCVPQPGQTAPHSPSTFPHLSGGDGLLGCSSSPLGVMGTLGWYSVALFLSLLNWAVPSGVIAKVLERHPGTGAPATVEGQLFFSLPVLPSLPSSGVADRKDTGSAQARRSSAEAVKEPLTRSVVVTTFYISNAVDAGLIQKFIVTGSQGTIEIPGAVIPVASTTGDQAHKEGGPSTSTYQVITHTQSTSASGETQRLRRELVKVLPIEVGDPEVQLWRTLLKELRHVAYAATSPYARRGRMTIPRWGGGRGALASSVTNRGPRFVVQTPSSAMESMKHVWMIQHVVDKLLESASQSEPSAAA